MRKYQFKKLAKVKKIKRVENKFDMRKSQRKMRL